MRSRFVRVAFAAVVLSLTCNSFAAPFVNLDFEQATVVPVGGGFIQAAAAFPGWTPRIGNSTTSNAAYNTLSHEGPPRVSLFDVPTVVPVLQGQYMAALGSWAPFPEYSSLEQAGQVPADALTIRMLANWYLGPPVVRMNGVIVPMQSLTPSVSNIGIFAGEISAFAGSTVLLQLSSGKPPSQIVVFDAIEFSPLPIPEPTAAVLTLGWTLRFFTRRSRSRRSMHRRAG
jgi:hypothetical protein